MREMVDTSCKKREEEAAQHGRLVDERFEQNAKESAKVQAQIHEVAAEAAEIAAEAAEVQAQINEAGTQLNALHQFVTGGGLAKALASASTSQKQALALLLKNGIPGVVSNAPSLPAGDPMYRSPIQAPHVSQVVEQATSVVETMQLPGTVGKLTDSEPQQPPVVSDKPNASIPVPAPV